MRHYLVQQCQSILQGRGSHCSVRRAPAARPPPPRPLPNPLRVPHSRPLACRASSRRRVFQGRRQAHPERPPSEETCAGGKATARAMARGLIYAFVARRPSTVLCDHTAFAGNFSVVALQVRCGQERQSSPPKKKDVAWRVGIFARRARQAGHQASDLRGPAQLVPVERSRRAGCGAQSCGRRRCARSRALQKEEKPLLRRLFARPLVSPRTRKVLQRTAAEEGALLCPHPRAARVDGGDMGRVLLSQTYVTRRVGTSGVARAV